MIRFARLTGLCFLFLFAPVESLTAQGVAAYNDYKNYFQAFDRGSFHQLEYLPVKSYKVGGNAIAYIDNTNEFRIFYNGQKYHQVYASDLNYYVSDYLVAYKSGTAATVFEKGKSRKLTFFCSNLYIGDSLVAYFDDSNYTLGVYYNGTLSVLENSLLQNPYAVKTGSNLLAYVDQSGFFKIFYRGQLHNLDNISPVNFEAGRDIVAFVDSYNRYFNLFYQGQTAQLEINQPLSYKVGNGLLAYVDYQGNFRVFTDGNTRKLLSLQPDLYDVKGNIIVYASNNEFRAFYNNQSILLDDYVPTDYKTANEGVAWIDVNGVLKFYHRGKTHVVSYERVNKFFVNNDVVWYLLGTNTWKVFYQGTSY